MKKIMLRIMSTILCLSLVFSTAVFPKAPKVKAQEKKQGEEHIKQIFINEQKKKQQEKIPKTSTNTSKNPNEKIRVIVQMKQEPSVKSNKTIASVKSSQNSIKEKAEDISGTKVRQTYGYLINGFSMDVKRSDIAKLNEMVGVKSVTEVRRYYPSMTGANELTQVLEVWKDMGYKGEGTVISIIDSGIDVSHKDMRISDVATTKIKTIKSSSETKFTNKVPYGRNFADNNDNVKDLDTKSMHGMHVAGIVAANGVDDETNAYKAIKGVAPEAQLLAMKVFTNDPDVTTAYDDDIIAAMEDSVIQGADIINMSLGSDGGFQDDNDPQQVAVKNATEKGVMVVVAAGNEAISSTDNNWSAPQKNSVMLKDNATIGAPSTAKDALAVASFENKFKTVNVADFNIQNVNKKISYVIGSGNPLVLKDNYQLVDCGIGSSEEVNGKDLKGKIALMKRGETNFSEKVATAKVNGASAVIVYNQSKEERPDEGGDGTFGMGGLEGETFPSLACGYTNGKFLIDGISKGGTFKFTDEMAKEENPLASDMSPFTSWGPTQNLDLKPEITAPGGNIYSTANNNSYMTMSGTSMATPYVSGSEALLYQALKKTTNLSGRALVEVAKNSTVNTAEYLMDKHFGNGKIPYSPRRQGSGLIQVKNALNNKVVVLDDSKRPVVALREIEKETSFNLNLTNYGKQDVTYNLESTKVLSEKNVDEDKHVAEYEIKDSSIKFDKTNIVLHAGETVVVKATINIPENFEKNNFVEGYITFVDNSGMNPKLSVPYMGFYGDWSQEDAIDKPLWKEGSQFGKTGLLWGSGGYLGGSFDRMTMSETVNPENIVISPNDDGNFDIAIPLLAIRRNIKVLDVDLVDKNDGNEKLLRKISRENNVAKNLFRFKDAISPVASQIWDGTVYDSDAGKYATAKDGKYFIRLGATLDAKNTKPQYTYIPIKVDTTKPKISILDLNKIDDQGNYKVTWSEQDELSGISDETRHVLLNDQIIDNEFPIIKEADNTYSCTFKVDNKVNNWLTVGSMDLGWNVGTKTILLNEQVIIHKFIGGMIINKNNLNKDGTYTIIGSVKPNVKQLSVNGVKVNLSVDDHEFEVNIPVQEGKNELTIISKNDNQESFTQIVGEFFLDSTAPTLEITEPVVNKDGFITVDNSKVTVKGKVSDSVSLAQKCTVNVGYNKVNVNEDGTFQSEINIPWDREIRVRVADEAGNEVSKKINIVFEEPDKDFKIYFDNIESLTTVAKDSKDVEDNYYTIKGRVNKKIQIFTINGEEVKLSDSLNFEHKVLIKQAYNKITVFAKGSDGKVFYNHGYNLWYDSIDPILTIFEPLENSDGKLYTNKDELTIKGKVSDNTFGYTLNINGDSILYVKSTGKYGSDNNEREFKYDTPVKNGMKINVALEDMFGNHLYKTYSVVVDKVAPTISITGIENNKSYKSTTLKPTIFVDDKDAKKMMQLNGKPYNGEDISSAGLYKLEVSAEDKAGNKSIVAVTFTIEPVPSAETDVPGTEIFEKVIDNGILGEDNINVIRNSGEKVANIKFKMKDSSNNDMLISLTAPVNDLKPLDFTMNKIAPNNDSIMKIDKNAQILSFKDNGVLPADTTIKVKVDATKIDITKDIFFFYFNPKTKKVEQIGDKLRVDKDGYVTLTIKHCSDYFLSNKSNTQLSTSKLVKTGSMVDTNVLLALGSTLAVLGTVFIILRRKKQY